MFTGFLLTWIAGLIAYKNDFTEEETRFGPYLAHFRSRNNEIR